MGTAFQKIGRLAALGVVAALAGGALILAPAAASDSIASKTTLTDPTRYDMSTQRGADMRFTESEFVPQAVTAEAPVAITAPANGSVVESPNVVVQGTGEPGAEVVISVGEEYEDAIIGFAAVGDDGTWSASFRFAYGEIFLKAETGYSADRVTFTVAVPAPEITLPEDDAILTTQPTAITGTGIVGSVVTLTLDEVQLRRVLVDADGVWTVTVDEELSSGVYSITAVQTKNRATSPADRSSFTLNVDTNPTPTPTPTPGPVAPVEITFPARGSIVAGPGVLFQGTGEPGARLILSGQFGDFLGEADVDIAGNWSLGLKFDFGYERVADVVQRVGDEVSWDETMFDVTFPAPEITSPKNGAELFAPPTAITGTAVTKHDITVTLNGLELGEATVSENGSWEIAIDGELAFGAHSITATHTEWGMIGIAARSDFTLLDASPPYAHTGTGGSPDDLKSGGRILPGSCTDRDHGYRYCGRDR